MACASRRFPMRRMRTLDHTPESYPVPLESRPKLRMLGKSDHRSLTWSDAQTESDARQSNPITVNCKAGPRIS